MVWQDMLLAAEQDVVVVVVVVVVIISQVWQDLHVTIPTAAAQENP